MPTIKQLPVATAVSASDVLPLSQSGLTRGVTVGTLLSGAQPSISLGQDTLLGRVSPGSGGPEAVGVGAGVALQSGALVATGADHSGFAIATDLLAGDELIVNSAATPKRLPATKLRSLFTAGAGVLIDNSGVISAPGGGVAGSAAVPATPSVLGGVKVGSGLAVASDGTLTVADISASIARVTGGTSARTIADRLADTYSLLDFGTASYVPGSGGDDLPAFNAALAKLTALGGGRLTLPAGTFRVSGPIVPPVGSGPMPLQVVGQGDATVVVPTAAMSGVFVVNEGNLLLADFALTNSGGFASSGLCITKPADNSRCEFERLTFASFGRGVWVQNGDVLHFQHPRFVACGTAFSVDNGMLNSSIAEMYVLGGNGIDVAVPTTLQPEGLQVIGGKILPGASGSFGVRLRAGLEIAFSGLVIDQLAAAGANGFVIDSSGTAIRAIKITNCWTGINVTATGTGSGIKLVGSATEQLHIEQHSFDSHGAYGLEVDGGAGLLLDLVVSHSRFRSNAGGDVSLKGCRAVFLGCDFRHPTASIVTAGTQVQVAGLGNRFAANPQLGAIAGGFYAANLGNTNDSLDGQSIGVNARAPTVAAGTLDVLSTATFRGAAAFQAGVSVSSGGATVAGNIGATGSVSAGGPVAGSNLGNGAGDPEGSVAGTPGTLYQHLSASTSLTDHSLFVKESGTGNTGWKAVATQDYVSRTVATMLPSVPVTALYGGSGIAGAAQQVTPAGALTLLAGSLAVRTATTSQIGVVQPDGTSITINAGGVISAVGGGTTTPLGSAAPRMNGTVAAGTSTSAAHEDHVHPTDTTRAPLASPVFTGSITLPTWTSTTRPSAPAPGMEGFASDTGRRETWNGTSWNQYVRTTDIAAGSAGQLLGATGTAGTASAIAIGSGLSLAGGTLSATASGTPGSATPRIVTSSAALAILPTDGLVCLNRTTSPAPTTVTLESSPVAGAVHRIKDMAGNAGAYPITVQPAAGTIDGAANFIINQNRGALTVEYNGSEWSVT